MRFLLFVTRIDPKAAVTVKFQSRLRVKTIHVNTIKIGWCCSFQRNNGIGQLFQGDQISLLPDSEYPNILK